MDGFDKVLRIFIAMPGDMSAAEWKSSAEVKQYFFEPIKKRLEEITKRPVQLFYETDKNQPGSIYSSMFSEAWEAEAYIADITGDNPNVYLELGVRWASRDNVTVIVGQNVGLKPLKFNVAASRAIRYGEGAAIREDAINRVVQSIKYGLDNKDHTDSLVRDKAELTTISKKDLISLEEQIELFKKELQELRSRQGLEYLDAAKSLIEEKEYNRAIDMLRKVIEINGTLVDAYFYLGIVLRIIGEYDEAITVLQQGISLNQKRAELHRELGVAYNKKGLPEEGVRFLNKAVELDPTDAEAWSNRGGGFRRLGMTNPPDWNALREARDSYYEALKLDPYNLYTLGNVAKLDLALSKDEPNRELVTENEFEQLKHLSDYQVLKTPDDYWRLFDRADAYLLSGDLDKGNQYYHEAIEKVDRGARKSVLSSVSYALNDLIDAEVLKDPLKSAIQRIIKELEQAIRDAEAG